MANDIVKCFFRRMKGNEYLFVLLIKNEVLFMNVAI